MLVLSAEFEPNLKGLKADKNRFKVHIGPAFGRSEPKDIQPMDVISFRNRLLKTRAPATGSPPGNG